MIENHMVLNTPDAPWNAPDDTRRREDCMICKRVMVRSNKSGQTDWITEDELDLEYARRVPGGLVCGRSCASQALFNSLPQEKQWRLWRCMVALAELWTCLPALGVRKPHQSDPSILSPYMEFIPFRRLLAATTDPLFLLLGDSNEDAPAWTESKL